MKLLNVRLNADDVRMADRLRREGIPISRIVREAIRAEYGRRNRGRGAGRTAAHLMAEIYAACPDPPGPHRRRPDLRDRRAVRQMILKRLRRPRS